MKLQVDRSKCRGHGQCWSANPQLFALDDEGFSAVIEPSAVLDHQVVSARRGVDACPEQALRLIDETRD